MLILLLLYICVTLATGDENLQPMVVTSLVHEFDLPKNPLINPFYDSELETLRTHNRQIADVQRRRRSTGAMNITASEVNELTDRAAVDSAWETLIVSGPTAVNLLSQVMVLSSKLDFSFREAAPNYTFQYVKYPDSFRMTLIQISNEAWRAFLTAHISMDKLQMNMQRIPGHVKVALKVLNEVKSPKLLETQMSKTLNTIARIGTDCITVANETHAAFSDVMNHLGEAISLTEVSKGLRETRLRETEIELNVSRVWQSELKQLNTLLKEYYEGTVEDLQFAHVQYSRALARRPSRLERALTRIAGAFLKLVNNAVRALKRRTTDKSSALNSLTSGQVAPTSANGKALLMAQSLSDSLQDLISVFKEIFYPNKNQTATRGPVEMENILHEMQSYTQLIGNVDSAANFIQPLAARAKDLGTRATQFARDYTLGKDVHRNATDELLSQLQQLVRDMKSIDAAAGLIDDSSSSQTDGGYSSDNAKMLVQITERKLQDARNRSAMSLIQLRQNMDEMNALVGKIALLDLTRINHAELLDYMRQALRLLGTMRQTWAQLVLFFSTVASQAEIALTGTLGPFIKQATMASGGEISTEERNFFIDILKDQSETIHETSYSLFLMSRTYVDMSNEFLMPRLTVLSLMVTARDDLERMKLNGQIASETKTTQAKVKALVEERKARYTAMIEEQRMKLKVYLDSLGGPSVENQQAIEQGSQLLDRERLI